MISGGATKEKISEALRSAETGGVQLPKGSIYMLLRKAAGSLLRTITINNLVEAARLGVTSPGPDPRDVVRMNIDNLQHRLEGVGDVKIISATRFRATGTIELTISPLDTDVTKYLRAVCDAQEAGAARPALTAQQNEEARIAKEAKEARQEAKAVFLRIMNMNTRQITAASIGPLLQQKRNPREIKKSPGSSACSQSQVNRK